MNETDWIYRNRILNKMCSFGSIMVFIGALLLLIGIWFLKWSLGAKLCFFGIGMIVFGAALNKGAKIAQKRGD